MTRDEGNKVDGPFCRPIAAHSHLRFPVQQPVNARALALQVLLSWHRTGTYPDQLLRDLLAKNPQIKSVDRSLVYQLVFGVLRWQGKIDWVLKQFSQIALEKLSLRTLFILRLGIFQLLLLSRIPVSAAVNESVKLAKSGPEPWTANFINAVLRSLDRGRDGLSFPSREDPVSYLAVNYSHPVRLVEHWIAVFGFEKTLALCEFNNQIPPYTIRVNTAKITRPQLIKRLEPKGPGSGSHALLYGRDSYRRAKETPDRG